MRIVVRLRTDNGLFSTEKYLTDSLLFGDSWLRGEGIYPPIILSRSIIVGQAEETDSAQKLAKIISITQASETDSAISLLTVPVKIAVGIASEIESAQSVRGKKTKSIGQPLEVDSAQSALPVFVRRIAVAKVLETELAQAVGKKKTRVIVQTLEADSADRAILKLKVTSLAVSKAFITDAELADFSIEPLRELISEADVYQFEA
jgi:hypothetical protein